MKLSRGLAFVAVVGAAFSLPDCADNENSKFPDVPNDGLGDEVAPPKPAQPHKNTNAQPKVTECPNAVAPRTETCTVTSTGTGGKVLRGTILAATEVFHNGELLFDKAGYIQCVGCDCSDHAGYGDASVVSCADGVISPGLINPHEHLTYENNRPIPHGAVRYGNRAGWQGPQGLQYSSTKDKTLQAFGELRFLMSGTTAIAGAGGAPGLLRNLDVQEADMLEGLPATIASSDTFPLTKVPNDTSRCPYEQRTKAEIAPYDGYLPHISEGIDTDAHTEFLCTSGDDANNLVQPQTGIIHAVALNAQDAQLVRKGMTKVVWSPRSNVDLYGNTAQAVMLDIAGVMIALGSDWVPSGSMNMLRELRCADEWNQKYFDKHFTDADLWRMATTNAAYASGVGYALGLLKEGYIADIAIYDGKTSKDFRAVLDAGVEDVTLVLRGGRAMYGDDALVRDAIWGDGDGCEAFPDGVCGKEKAVCIDVRLSAGRPTLEELRYCGEVEKTEPRVPCKTPGYPLFFCKGKTPDDEPSCHPSRTEGNAIYTGNPTPTDSDGDGLPDFLDDCPKVFNPIRPMDFGRQADADNDGIGDACDECPNDKDQKCKDHPTSSDLDGDGVPNDADNCPQVSNPDQEDEDGDGHGDACDPCPVANPGATACPVAIATLRNPDAYGHPDERANVAFDGYVSAKVSGNCVFVQTATEGAPWQGIYVLTGALEQNASIGQKVHVVGRYSNKTKIDGFFVDVDGVTAATVDPLVGPIEAMTPLLRRPAEVNTTAGKAAEPYESLLLTVGAVTLVNDNPDKGKFFNFIVDGDLRVGDFLYSAYGSLSLANETCGKCPYLRQCAYPRCAVRNGKAFTNLVGVLGYSFGNRKLYPRGIPDLGPNYLPKPCDDVVPAECK